MLTDLKTSTIIRFSAVIGLIIVFSVILTRAETEKISLLQKHYNKYEYSIPMRDGIKLFTIVYTPKNKKTDYPILLNRTCYNASQYGNYENNDQPSNYLVKEKFIIVYQDVRGRYLSEGKFTTMTPNIPGNDPMDENNIDESSDTWDTIDWLIKNIKGNNGKVGMFGISYPGFYTAAAIPDAHPALKASSPQAPVSDFFFDDFHHHGAFLQSYLPAFGIFGYQKESLTNKNWFDDELMRFFGQTIPDGYDFYLNLGSLKNVTDKYHYDNFFWKEIVEHPNYDEFWQKRNLLPHLKKVNHAVMTVGGWYDAEDLYGSLNIYKTIELNNPNANNILVMGPWTHGDWSHESEKQIVNDIYYGDSISTFYQREIELPFFKYFLKSTEKPDLPEAYLFDTGIKEWKKFDKWPPTNQAPTHLSFGEKEKLYINKEANNGLVFEYTSDPAKPVPYTSQKEGLTLTPRKFITDDQRNASTRPDVLTFKTATLTENITVAGEIMAKLSVSMTGTDADFIVKLIDVYPNDHKNYEHNPDHIKMGGYQQLVRHETFRGRYRNSYEAPEPFKPNIPTDVNFPLQDILHTFKKGHRIMIQIHSTWFPYIDRNPQKYVDNIFEASEEDFIKSTIRIYGNSSISIGGGLQKMRRNND